MKVREEPTTPCTMRDVAGQKVRQLRQEQRRAQVPHQPFIEERGGFRNLAHAAEDRGVDGDVALAAAGVDDHVGVVEEIGLAGDAGVAEREARRVDADPLPGLHLPLVAFLRNLLVETHRRQRMHDVGREALVIVGGGSPRSRWLPTDSSPSPRQVRRPTPVIHTSRRAVTS